MSATPRSRPDAEPDLAAIVERALEACRAAGATHAEAEASRSQGFSVNVRMGDVETVEHNRDKGLVVSVYFGDRTGAASSSDFSEAAVMDTVRAACSIAKFTAEDPANGLADPERLARDLPELDLVHPWAVTVEEAIALAKKAEDTARAADARIVNSEGASVSTRGSVDVYGNSHGFVGTSRGTSHSMGCAVIGQTASGMQRDYWYTAARDAAELEAPERVGTTAANRTVRRLDAERLSTRQCPVLYEAPVAASLLSHFVGAIRGGALYRKASFLLDKVGEKVFADGVRIHEQPHIARAMGSAAFDNEGVATAARDLVADGVLQGYVLDSYSARKLGLETTGNAGGVHNLTIDNGDKDFRAMLAAMDTGLLVTELIGFGVNAVTGDYSRGCAGFWVAGGEIRQPVEEITVAGNLADIFLRVVEVGNDVDTRGNTRTGSILIESMTVAGT